MLGNFKEWVMKKRFSLLWSLLAMVVVCACSKSGGSDYPDPEKAGLTFQVTFDKTGMEGRAPQVTIYSNSGNFMGKCQAITILIV